MKPSIIIAGSLQEVVSSNYTWRNLTKQCMHACMNDIQKTEIYNMDDAVCAWKQ